MSQTEISARLRKNAVPTFPTAAAPFPIRFTRLLQYALYVNGFSSGECDGVFDSETEKALSDFQTLMGIETTGKAELDTWLRLLTAPGDSSRGAVAADLQPEDRDHQEYPWGGGMPAVLDADR